MAIQPIHFAASELKVPQADWSWLANLVPNIQATRANSMKIAEGERRQGALAELAKLDPNDPNFAQQVAAAALRMGDVGSAVSAINNAAELKLKREEAAREAAIGQRFSSPPTAAPATTPAAAPATPPAAPPAAVAPGVPGLGTTPGQAPLFTRTPNVSTSALPGGDIAPVAQQTPPILAQRSAQGFMAAPDRSNVRFGGVSSELLQHANEVGNSLYGTLNRPLYVTSARDSTHTTGSQHYGGNALDLRTRDLSPAQRRAIVAGFQAKGLTAVDEGDHIHVAMPRGAAPQPGAPGAAGTVTASLQGRGPISTGYGGATIASASPGVLNTPMARTQVAALDPSFAPQSSMTDAGPQLPAGVSPAAPAAQGAAGPPILPNPTPFQTTPLPTPTPLQAPVLSLAALGSPPGGGVGTIGPMGGTSDAMPPQGVQVAQAAQRAPVAPYSPAWPIPSQQGSPALPVRPPVQQAPVPPQAPVQQPVQARGAASGAPMEHVSNADLIAASGSKRWGEMARAELARRSTVAADANKTSPEYNNFVQYKRANPNYTGDWLQYQQDLKADVTLKRTFDAINADRAKRGLGEYPGGLEKLAMDLKAGTSISIGDKIDPAENSFVKRMETIGDAGDVASNNRQLISAMREMGVKGGFTSAMIAKAGEFGVNLPGTDRVQALSSLLDFMVPAQPRTPGPQAAMETNMLRNSLPKIINQEGSTEITLAIMDKAAEIEEKRADIANKYRTSEKDDNGKRLYTAAMADKDLKALREESRGLIATAVRLAAGKSAPAAASGGTGTKWTYPEGTSDEDKAAADKILQDAMRKR